LDDFGRRGLGDGLDPGFSRNIIEDFPESSTLAMMLIGFASLGYAGYRRSQRPG
jgi:hypothetical protein